MTVTKTMEGSILKRKLSNISKFHVNHWKDFLAGMNGEKQKFVF